MGKEVAARFLHDPKSGMLDSLCCCVGSSAPGETRFSEPTNRGLVQQQTCVQLDQCLFENREKTTEEAMQETTPHALSGFIPVLHGGSFGTSGGSANNTASVCTESTGSEINTERTERPSRTDSLKGLTRGVNSIRPVALFPTTPGVFQRLDNGAYRCSSSQSEKLPRLLADENGDLMDTWHPCYREFTAEYASGAKAQAGDSQDTSGGVRLRGKYVGQVLAGTDTFHGQGQFSTPSWTFSGEWLNGAMHGQGRQDWEDGRKYVGQFKDGRFNGYGSMQWRHAKGIMAYEGQYCEDKKHGFGKFTWPSGKNYDGQWVCGQRHGIGFDTSAKGIRFRGRWQDGSLLTHVDDNDKPVQDFQAVKSVKRNNDILYM